MLLQFFCNNSNSNSCNCKRHSFCILRNKLIDHSINLINDWIWIIYFVTLFTKGWQGKVNEYWLLSTEYNGTAGKMNTWHCQYFSLSQIHIWSIGWCTERAGTWDKWIIRVVWGVKNLESWLNLLRNVKALLVLSHLQRGRSGFNSKFQFQYYGNVFGSEYLKTALEILHKYLQILYFKTWHIWWHIWWYII